MSSKRIAMLGVSLEWTGGMASVARMYRDHGALDSWNVQYIGTWKGQGLARQIRAAVPALAKFLWLLLTRQLVLVHAHSAARGSFWRKSLFCFLARCFDVPYIFHIHSGEFLQFFHNESGPLAKRWIRITLERAACVIVLTEGWRAGISAIAPKGNFEVIGNPVLIPKFLSAKTHGNGNVLFLGRLYETKGVFDLVRAVPRVVSRVPGACFCLAGDGNLEAVRELAVALGVSEVINLPGWVDGADKDALLEHADVLVLPSYFEGLGVCLLEAMAFGVPVVAANVGGIPDVIENNVTGILVRPRDVESIADGLISILTNADLRLRLRLRAFDTVREHYSIERVFDAIERCYTKVGVAVRKVPHDSGRA